MLCSINRICINKHLGIPAILTAHLRPGCTVNAGLPVLYIPAPKSAPLHCMSLHPAVPYCTVNPSVFLFMQSDVSHCTINSRFSALSIYATRRTPLNCKPKALVLTLPDLVPCLTPLQSNPKLFALSCSILYPAAPHCNATPSYLRCPAVSCTLLHPTAMQPQAICTVLQYLVPCCTPL